MSPTSLCALAAAVESLPDPRSKQGVTHPYHGMLLLVLLGLITQIPHIAVIRRWAKKHLAHPMLKLLTGDAIFALRPLLEALQERVHKFSFATLGNLWDTSSSSSNNNSTRQND